MSLFHVDGPSVFLKCVTVTVGASKSHVKRVGVGIPDAFKIDSPLICCFSPPLFITTTIREMETKSPDQLLAHAKTQLGLSTHSSVRILSRNLRHVRPAN